MRLTRDTIARMLRRLSLVFGLGLVGGVALAGCFGLGSSTDTTSPDPTATGPSGTGIVLVNWSVNGQPPSTTSCTGVDHLTLRIDYDAGNSVEIAPIPCTLTRFRYDHLPTGSGLVTLTASAPTGCTLATASASIDVGDRLPTSPSPTLSLPHIGRCH